MPLVSSFFRLPGGRWSRRRARRTRAMLQLLLLAVIILVILPAYILYKPPGFVIKYLQRRSPEVLFHVAPPENRQLLALTIDDTPSEFTGNILELLKANDARATFFVIGGQVSGREDILADIVRNGHELGNHAMHDEPSLRKSTPDLAAEINQVDAMIEAAYKAAGTDRRAHYFRPGSGVFSDRILKVAEQAGYRTVLGSVYPHDPFISYFWINAWHILSMIRPGSVVICHDRRSWTLPMLAQVLPEMKRRGYEVMSVTQLLEATIS
nr:putative 30.6 kda protein in fuma 3'region [Quercus suber]